MHPCLNVEEIIRLIACELVASGGKKTAVALACCCKIFEDPVLDALWETQDRFGPLLKSFPEDVWAENVNFTFKRIPTQAEWTHFQKYARRIRTLRPNASIPPSPDALSVLQHHTLTTPLLPGLRTLQCRDLTTAFTPFISLLLSQATTTIEIRFSRVLPNPAILPISSMVSSLPRICRDLRRISLRGLPEDPVVIAAASEMLLTCNQNTLQKFDVDCPLTKEAREVLFRLPNLSILHSFLEGSTVLPPISLPNLVKMHLRYVNGHAWLQGFLKAGLRKLKFVSFQTISPQVGNFLEAFEAVALATSLSTSLSSFMFVSLHPWNPNHSSLLTFKQLTTLLIGNPCRVRCSSTVDDDILINLARAMPMMKVLQLGSEPCGFLSGVTVRGLVELGCHCTDLSTLRVHIRMDSLVQAGDNDATTPPPNDEPATPRVECSLTTLEVGNLLIPDDSEVMVALAILHIFPRIKNIKYTNYRWRNVDNIIKLSARLSTRIGALVRASRNTSNTG